jgi:hypothetical protein
MYTAKDESQSIPKEAKGVLPGGYDETRRRVDMITSQMYEPLLLQWLW